MISEPMRNRGWSQGAKRLCQLQYFYMLFPSLLTYLHTYFPHEQSPFPGSLCVQSLCGQTRTWGSGHGGDELWLYLMVLERSLPTWTILWFYLGTRLLGMEGIGLMAGFSDLRGLPQLQWLMKAKAATALICHKEISEPNDKIQLWATLKQPTCQNSDLIRKMKVSRYKQQLLPSDIWLQCTTVWLGEVGIIFIPVLFMALFHASKAAMRTDTWDCSR